MGIKDFPFFWPFEKLESLFLDLTTVAAAAVVMGGGTEQIREGGKILSPTFRIFTPFPSPFFLGGKGDWKGAPYPRSNSHR